MSDPKLVFKDTAIASLIINRILQEFFQCIFEKKN